jgi:hypothetical protein
MGIRLTAVDQGHDVGVVKAFEDLDLAVEVIFELAVELGEVDRLDCYEGSGRLQVGRLAYCTLESSGAIIEIHLDKSWGGPYSSQLGTMMGTYLMLSSIDRCKTALTNIFLDCEHPDRPVTRPRPPRRRRGRGYLRRHGRDARPVTARGRGGRPMVGTSITGSDGSATTWSLGSACTRLIEEEVRGGPSREKVVGEEGLESSCRYLCVL